MTGLLIGFKIGRDLFYGLQRRVLITFMKLYGWSVMIFKTEGTCTSQTSEVNEIFLSSLSLNCLNLKEHVPLVNTFFFFKSCINFIVSWILFL